MGAALARGVGILAALLAAAPALADAINGAWGPVIPWPHIAVSMANLPDGRVLTWSGSERDTWPTTEQTYSATWDPATGQFVEIFHPGHNMFCAHQTLTETGSVFVNGGRNFQNSPWTSVFDYRFDIWTQIENMATGGRWYPVTLSLPSGEIMTSMGTATNFRNPEKWAPAPSWQVLNGVDFNVMRATRGGTSGDLRWWPMLSVTPLGEVFHFWDSSESYLIETKGVGDFRNANLVSDDPNHAPGVSIQFAEGKLLVAGSNQGSWSPVPTAEAYVIDLNGTPTITATQSMSFPRMFANLVTLPTGEVLVIGGNTSGQTFSDAGSVLEAEIWDPATGAWRVVAAMSVPRNYHSTAILLTDGTVLSAGSGYQDNTPIPANHQDGQVFTPPYLFAPGGGPATRPSITSSPAAFTHGESLPVMATANVARFTMLRMSSTTHAVNTDARFHEVPFVETSPGQYTLTPTANPNLLLPGYWMLFAIDAAGVPSVAQVVLVQRVAPPQPWRYLRLTALSEVYGKPWTTLAELSVYDELGAFIGNAGWTASADSEEFDGLASMAIDGDPDTFWHTDYRTNPGDANDPPHPHELVVDLGQGYQISGISYLARQDGPDGRIEDYEVAFSADGVSWTTPVASGSFDNLPNGHGARFEFDVVDAGTYAAQGGVYGIDPASDSFWVRIDDQPASGYLWDVVGGPLYDDEYVSDRNNTTQVQVSLDAGRHTVTVFPREDAARLDDLRLENLSGGSSTPRIEAEHALLLGGFAIGSVGGASGGQYVHMPDNNNSSYPIGAPPVAEDVFFQPSFPLSQVDVAASPAAASGASVSFSATQGANLEYQWSFGDGTPLGPFAASPNALHTFSTPGRYNVVLTIRDILTAAEQSIATTQLVYDAAIDPADDGLRRLSSSSVVFHPTRDEIWNVNPDNATVTAIQASTLVKLAEVPVGPDPRSLAVAPDGKVWVVSKAYTEIYVIDPTTASVDSVIALGNGVEGRSPHGIVFAPSGAVAYVALEDSGEVLEIDTTTQTILRIADVGERPRHLAISSDGATLYVSRFITPPVPGEDTILPTPALGGGELVALDTGDFASQSVIVLHHSDDLETENTGPGLPNYLGPAAMSPDPGVAYVPSKQDNILGGSQRPGQDLDFDHTVRAISSRIDLGTGTESTDERIDHDNASVASHAVFGPYGVHLFTALEGNRQVAISDTLVDSEIVRFDVGRAPQGLALSPDGKRLAVHNFMDRTVEVVDVSDVVDFGGFSVTSLGVTSTVASEALTPQILLGKQHFYDSKDDRLAGLDYMACASCHNAGGGDGRTWDFSQFGEGLRTTIGLRGHGQGHGPLHWTANFDEVQDFEGQIRDFALGTGLMSDTDFDTGTRSDPLGDPKAGLSADLDALAAYVESLTTVGVSPYRDGNGDLSPEGLAGLALFEANGCDGCHAGAAFTDSAGLTLHDVGTLVVPDSGPQTALDTPTLLGLWATGPYLHDGSAPTLQDAIEAHSALALSLTPTELDLIAAYVSEIDDLESATWEQDTDGDGFPDVEDAFPNDPSEWADTDGDGVGDNGDAFPNDPSETVDTDGDGIGDNADPYPNDPTNTPPATVGRLHHGVVQNVGSSWVPVALPESYWDMVVVASVAYTKHDLPAVPRVRNAAGSGFEVRVQNPGDAPLAGYTVNYVVAESGVYTEAADGISFEASKVTSTITDEDGSWSGQAQSYANTYAKPVVIGQVMTENDPDWSVFWASNGAATRPPSAASLYVGKHVGEDPDVTRADETIGYMVFETGQTTVGALAIEARVGPDFVEGVTEEGAPYGYGVASPSGTAVVSSAAMDGANGGWPILYGEGVPSGGGLWLAIDEDQLADSERVRTNEQVAYVIVDDVAPPPAGPMLDHGVLASADSSWQEVVLLQSYADMVVIATPVYAPSSVPLVTRVRNAANDRFEVRVQSPSGSPVPPTPVHWVVAESGVFTQAEHGIRLEAVKFSSTLTDRKNSWTGEARSYQQAYTSPVVIGQVMSSNDAAWSVFWASDGNRFDPPSASALHVGKHVGEDSNGIRADETIGYIVVESGSVTVGGSNVEAGVTADTNRGPAINPLVPIGLQAGTAVLSAAGMDGIDGGWPVHREAPTSVLSLNVDEDQLADLERGHTTEQAAYLAIEE